MTVGTQMQQTIADCESSMANLKTFALETQDQNAKQLFQSLAKKQEEIVDHLTTRLQYLQDEDPRYKQM